MIKNKQINKGIVLFLIGYGLFLSIWMFMQNYSACNDEAMKYQVADFISKNWKLPTLYDASIRNKYFGTSYASRPMLLFIIQAIFIAVGRFLAFDENVLYIFARIPNIICGVVFAYVVYKICGLVFEKEKEKRYLLFITIVLWPENNYMFTYMSNDGLCVVGVAFIIYFCIKGLKNKWDIKSCIGLTLSNIITLLSYQTAYGYLFTSVICFVGYYIFINKDKNKWIEFIKKGAIIAGGTIIGAGGHFVRSYILYGSFFASGCEVDRKLSSKYGAPLYTFDYLSKHARENFFQVKGFLGWGKQTFFNYFGAFGWTNKFYPTVVYLLVSIVNIALIICGLLYIKQKIKRWGKEKVLISVGCFVACIITLLLDMYYAAFVDYQTQGRYILPILIPNMIINCFGISFLVEKNKNIYNKKGVMKIILIFTSLFLLIANTYALYLAHQ